MLSVLEICGVFFLISLISYCVPALLPKIFSPQDLKKRYPNADWALVTGASSGIGLAIAKKLSSQGFNVVIVAYPDDTLKKAVPELETMFPERKFISVGVDLSLPDLSFMKEVKEKTKDIDISLIFNNAGYLKTGFYTENSFEQQLANHQTNCTAVIAITHHFLKQMLDKKLKGCLCLTSSPAGFMPSPFVVSYGSTKAFLTEFALSIAPEIGPDGIDVTVLHPSPVNSNFYARKDIHMIDTLSFMKSKSTSPENVADSLFRCIGRSLICDQGWYTISTRLLLKLIDVNFMAQIILVFAPWLPDYKQMKALKKD
eukprot:snap_masked-scaffold_7-processed-gene-12.11-mRNA-1 protein AED:0.00 eAED:0.00 QI:0/-1/0/1/-1/1/1/0/313